MALDPSIALRAGNRQRRDPSREYANALAIKQAQGQIEAQKAEQVRQNALREAVGRARNPDGSVNYNALQGAMLDVGDVDRALSIGKGQADMAAAETTSELKALELQRERFGMAASLLGSARDDQTYQAALQLAGQMGLPVEGAPAQFDQAWVQQTLQQTLTAKERLDQQFEREKFAETQRHNRSTEGAAWARASRPDTVISMAGDNAYAEAAGKRLADRVDSVYKEGDLAASELAQLDMLRNIDVDFGALEPAKNWVSSIASSLGFDPEKVGLPDSANAEAFIGTVQNLVLRKMQAQKGPQTENDARRIESTLTRLGNRPEAARFLIDSAIALRERDLERADFYRKYDIEGKSMKEAERDWREHVSKTPLLGENPKTGRPVFYRQFREAVKDANPGANEDQILDLWRKKYGR